MKQSPVAAFLNNLSLSLILKAQGEGQNNKPNMPMPLLDEKHDTAVFQLNNSHLLLHGILPSRDQLG